MNKSISIAIIIPIYNGELYLKKCLDSIYGQSYKNFVVFLMNDGSKDNSGEICTEYESLYPENTKYVVLNNSGANTARKKALDSCDNDLIFFIDQDDWLHDSLVLEKIAIEFQKDVELEFVIFKYKEYFEKSDKYLERRNYSNDVNNLSVPEKIRSFVSNSTIPLSPWDKVFRRSYLIKYNIHLSTKFIASDINWFIDIVTTSKRFKVMNEVFYVYRRQVPTSMTTLAFSIKKFEDLLSIIEFESERVKKFNRDIQNSLNSFLAYEYCILLAMTSNLNDLEFDQYTTRISKLEYLLNYRENFKVKYVYWVKKIIGLKHTSRLMRYYIRKFVNRA